MEHTTPTSNWTHSHALQEGDELAHESGDLFRVTTVQDDGAIRVRLIDDDHEVRDTWGEEAVRMALAHDEMERVSDGKSHELATY